MYLDKQNLFSENQALGDTAVSTNVIDLGPEGGDGAGRKVAVVVTVAPEDLTSLAIQLQTDDVEAMSGAVAVLATPAIVKANLTAGRLIEIPIPALDMKRYARLNYVVVGTTETAGKVTAGIVLNSQSNG